MAALWDFVVLILIIQTVNGRSIETISGLLEESVKNCSHRLSKLEALLTEELKLQCGSPLPTEALLSNLTQWELEVKLNPVPELCYSLLASVQSVCHQQNVQLDPALLSLDSNTFCSKASTLKLADCEDTDCKVVVMTVEHVMGRQEHCKQKCLEDDTVLPVCLSLFYVKSAQSGNSAQLDNSGQSGKDSPSKVTREESTQKLPTDSKAPVPDPAAVAPGQEEGAQSPAAVAPGQEEGAQSPPAVAPGQEAPGETQPTPAEKKEAVEEGNGGEGGEAGEGDAGDAVGGGEKVEVGGVGGGGSGSGGETDAEAQIGGEEEQKGQVEEAGEAGQEGAYDEVLEDDEDGGGLLEQPPPGLHKMDEQAEKQQGQSKGVDTMNAGSDYEEKSNFFAYFVGLSFVCILAYLVFHNKQKILALILEGRRHQGSRRRSAGREYRKLDTNVEDSMDLTRRSSARQVIY